MQSNLDFHARSEGGLILNFGDVQKAYLFNLLIQVYCPYATLGYDESK
jgi:hypothetical protein